MSSLRAALCVAASLPLTACGSGFSLDEVAADRSIVTGAISQQAAGTADVARMSDEATIRNAVSSVIVDEIDEDGIGWANAGTGSRGMIRQVRETRDGGFLCRRFVASRESFDGVHIYRGETCLGTSRLWVMKSFDRVE